MAKNQAPDNTIPLPASVRTLVRAMERENHRGAPHPGLWLDKYVSSWDPKAPAGGLSERVQKPAIEKIVRFSGDVPAGLDFKRLLERHRTSLGKNENPLVFAATTIGPLTVHLSRASSLENAGIALHPIYGFAYLPGSGLKGMAHAYACQVWLPTQQNKEAAWQTICEVFGTAPSPRLRAMTKRLDVRYCEEARAGSVMFHDAWPTAWPKLIVDIVNNHHPDYYNAGEKDNDHPPGDWENPVPVYFLAVAPDTPFEFYLSKRRSQVNDLVEQAREWLAGALCHAGAGAKTNAGYGAFEVKGLTSTIETSKEIELDLVTPAFLGGTDRNAERLVRLPSVKAWIRQWWRAWHGHLSLADLRQQEAEVFGSVDVGARLHVSHVGRSVLKILPKDQDFGSGGSALGYLGFGPVAYVKDKKSNRTQVDALAPEQVIHFRLNHSAPSAMDECLKSLWLACAIGGVGSRNRRGWGSLLLAVGHAVRDLPNLRTARSIDEYRVLLLRGLEQLAPSANRRAAADTKWTALGRDTRIVLSKTTFANWRAAMEDLGRKFINFRGRDKRGNSEGEPGPDYHKTKTQLRGDSPQDPTLPERAAFGMPYAQAYSSLPKVHARRSPTATFTPVWTESGRTVEGRRASPLFCKIVRLDGGQFLWQVAFLPSQFLPAGAKVRGDRTDTQPKQALPVSSFDPPSALGVARGDRPDTLLLEFLDWVEGRSPVPSKLPPPKPPDVATLIAKTNRGAVKPKPVNQGQERTDGTLKRKENRWVVVFEGDKREAEIINPDKLPADISEATRCEFRVMQQSKQAGISVRFNRIMEK